MRVVEMCGKKYGELTVLDRNGKMYGQAAWLCQCSCGNYKTIAGDNLRKGCSTSCGCKWKRNGNKNPLWSGYEEISGSVWTRIQSGAKARNLEFNINIEYVWNLFIQQNKKCKLTNLDIFMAPGSSDEKRAEATASLDRIDPKKGYIEGNVQWVHKDVNRMKNHFNQQYFIDICKHIAKNA